MPISTLKQKNAFNSSSETSVHLLYFSTPITILEYLLVCVAISSNRSCVKNKPKTCKGEEERLTVGPARDEKSWRLNKSLQRW